MVGVQVQVTREIRELMGQLVGRYLDANHSSFQLELVLGACRPLDQLCRADDDRQQIQEPDATLLCPGAVRKRRSARAVRCHVGVPCHEGEQTEVPPARVCTTLPAILDPLVDEAPMNQGQEVVELERLA